MTHAAGNCDPLRPGRPAVAYVLYSGDLYGTEKMAIMHLHAVSDQASTVLLAPRGPIHAAAKALDIQTIEATTATEIFHQLARIARNASRLTFLTVSVTHALIGLAVGALFPWQRIVHLNVCHGGESSQRSFGRKRILNWTPVRLVAVSHYCAELLRRFGVPARRIQVVGNFLTDERILHAPRRTPGRPPLRVLAACRLVPVKRVDLLVTALRMEPRLSRMLRVRVLGDGPLLGELQAASEGLNIAFEGFCDDVPKALAQSDLFVQTWADEPFGLAVVEAMAAGVTVVTPDSGGAAEIVANERHGLFYRANDARSLADALLAAASMSEQSRSSVGEAGAARARSSYSLSARRDRILDVFVP
jgi:glycosyltransferase involved in cell wall biosynthesis